MRTASILVLLVVLVAGCRRGELDPRVDGDVVHLGHAPPPLSGGTLAVLRDGTTAVVADPDRDRILVVDLDARAVEREIALAPDDEPGRIAEDDAGRVHVALRGSGELLTLEPGDATAPPLRRAACSHPRGVAFDAARAEVLVACRGGELVTFPPAGGEASSTLQVRDDLRDVLVVDGRRFVTTFRSAHLLELSAEGVVIADRAPDDLALTTATGVDGYTASVAWRAIVLPGTTTIAMVHQRGRETPIVVHAGRAATAPTPGAYAAASGGTSSSTAPLCRSGVVHGAVTFFDADGTVRSGGAIIDAVLPVDLAAIDGSGVSVVAAGNQAGDRSVFHASPTQLEASRPRSGGCALTSHEGGGAATAIAFDGRGEQVVLERDPAVLVVGGERIALGGVSVFDTGHALFHGNAGTNDACASCHPEGGDDGRVWNFDGDPRRTQTVGGGVLATAPFHWDGEDADFGALTRDVFETRMRGPSLSDGQVDAFGAWVDAIPAVHGTVRDAAAVARGRALFEGTAGCAECHSGPHFTNGLAATVGTTSTPLQVPTLVGASMRLPLMRSGCASSVAARFSVEGCGGGEAHGHVSGLDAAQRADLVAYVESL